MAKMPTQKTLREILEWSYTHMFSDIDQAISEIKSLIKEKLPKLEEYLSRLTELGFTYTDSRERGSGYQQALTEIEKLLEEL